MEQRMKIAICGGDERQKFLAESLYAAGFPVMVWGFSKLSMPETIPECSILALVAQCDCFILPLPATVDGHTLFAPYSETPLFVDDGLAETLRGKTVFAGLKSRLEQADAVWKEVGCLDYSQAECFAIRNAFPTVEGALAIAIEESDRTLRGSRCLVTGFGRIGKVLCDSLCALGAKVTVAARSQQALTWAQCLGYEGIAMEDLAQDLRYDFIFNTVPAMVFSAQVLEKMPQRCVAIELASAPWGFDFAAGEKLGRKIVKAPALPGRFSPRTAGEIIKDTILTMMKE